jgi:L-malate glycosyltransferase
MKEHDAFLLTSEYETFSIVLAEAWLTGIPVITTSVGIGANLPAELGVNIAQNDPDALGNELIRFAKGTYTFDSETIRKHALQFTDEVVLQQLKDTFERFFDLHD